MAKRKQSKEPTPPPPAEPVSHTEEIEKALVKAALEKRAAGQTPTAPERAALKRSEDRREEDLRQRYYARIPQKHWREMSGRQAKILQDQAALYGIPFDRPEIDLRAVVRALHDFLATHHQKYRRRQYDPDTGEEEEEPTALERLQEERYKRQRLARLKEEGKLADVAKIRAGLALIASLLRSSGESLQKKHGPDALEILDSTLCDCERQIERMFLDDSEDAE